MVDKQPGNASLMNIQALSTSEKIHLAEQLWESVRSNPEELKLTQEQRQLLEERLESYRKDGDPGDTWANVRERILKRLE